MLGVHTPLSPAAIASKGVPPSTCPDAEAHGAHMRSRRGTVRWLDVRKREGPGFKSLQHMHSQEFYALHYYYPKISFRHPSPKPSSQQNPIKHHNHACSQ